VEGGKVLRNHLSADAHDAPYELKVPMTPTDLEIYKELMDHLSDGVFIADVDRRILYCNEAAFRLTGYKAEEIEGQICRDKGFCPIGLLEQNLCHGECPLETALRGGGIYNANVFIAHKNGYRIPVGVHIRPIRAANGSIIGVAEVLSDDSARQEAQRKTEELERLAFLDPLTQMPNRRFVEMSLQTAMQEYQLTNSPFGVLATDLNKLKTINDLFGHANGDRALREVAKMLAGTLRPTDTFGRWGGDEFLAVVRNVENEALKRLAYRCVNNVAQISFSANGDQMIFPTVSIGWALVCPEDSIEKLIERADGLLYDCKTNGPENMLRQNGPEDSNPSIKFQRADVS
jgi:diguanylate cyclase (GGDEF)-like protein/PAS domain S-box-containing protein